MSRRILGTNSRISGAMPPSASTRLTTRTRPLATGSSSWSKTTLPNSNGHSLTQRRPASTAVMVKEPPRLPRCLAQPDTPGSNGPSSRAISLLTSHSGQRATSVHKAHTTADPASSVASHSNRYMPPPEGTQPESEASRPGHSATGVRNLRAAAGTRSTVVFGWLAGAMRGGRFGDVRLDVLAHRVQLAGQGGEGAEAFLLAEGSAGLL